MDDRNFFFALLVIGLPLLLLGLKLLDAAAK